MEGKGESEGESEGEGEVTRTILFGLFLPPLPQFTVCINYVRTQASYKEGKQDPWTNGTTRQSTPNLVTADKRR